MLDGSALASESIESVCFAACTGQQERIAAGHVRRPPVVYGKTVKFDRIFEDADAIVDEVGVPRVGDIAVAKVVEGVDLPWLDLATVLGQLAHAFAKGCDRVGKPSACLDFGKLVMVADQDHLGSRIPGSGDDVMQVGGAAHAGLVHDDDAARSQGMIEEVMVETGHGERGNLGASLEFACGTC